MPKKTAEREELQSIHYRAIAMLVQGYSVPEVASNERIQVSERLVYKWLKSPLFKDELETQKRVVFESNIAKIIQNTDVAVDTLIDVCQNAGSAIARVQAAEKLLDGAFRHLDRDLERRIEKIEAQQDGSDENGT